MNSKKGFTLSEVLITLAIIGVVAALTIPAVVKNYQKTQTVAKLKKAWSTINQAYNNSQAQNGMYQTWDKAFDIGAREYFNRYWKPYFKVAKICTSYSDCGFKASAPWKGANGIDTGMLVVWVEARTTFLTPDGTLFLIFSTGGDATAPNDSVYVDLNGSNEPNILGRDLFYFIRTDKGIMPFCYNSSMAGINSECSKTNSGTCCAAKIAREGWEIKDDYPW